jgi:dTDP-4-dehydrorhamnose 3,5-epimerase
MRVTATAIADVLLVEPRVLADERGFFLESFNAQGFAEATGIRASFVQDNHSRSRGGVLRGLHYQFPKPQGKLVRVVRGTVLDVAVDLRRSSGTFGRWVSAILSDENHHQLWLPEGFAHGFVTLSESADVLYKTTDYYAPEHERCIRWNDSAIGIAWPIASPIVSSRDAGGSTLADAVTFP